MSIVIPKYTRRSVNRAGEFLSKSNDVTKEDLEWAGKVLTNWRASHAHPINTFQVTLRGRVKQIDKHAFVAQRLKRTPSILNKLNRFNSMNLVQMQDIGGLRAVVSSVAKVRNLEKKYRDGRLKHELVSWKDYIEEPKNDGYRSVHLIFKYSNDSAPEFNNILIELQLRTKMQHAWATAVETMETFLGQALKSGKGDKKWREFFIMTSVAMSHMEKTAVIAGYEKISPAKIFKIVAEMDKQLGVLEKLDSFAVAADHISTEKGKGSYHLIILNSVTKVLTIRPYPKSKLEEANKDYADVERRASKEKNWRLFLSRQDRLKILRKHIQIIFLIHKTLLNRFGELSSFLSLKKLRTRILKSQLYGKRLSATLKPEN